MFLDLALDYLSRFAPYSRLSPPSLYRSSCFLLLYTFFLPCVCFSLLPHISILDPLLFSLLPLHQLRCGSECFGLSSTICFLVFFISHCVMLAQILLSHLLANITYFDSFCFLSPIWGLGYNVSSLVSLSSGSLFPAAIALSIWMLTFPIQITSFLFLASLLFQTVSFFYFFVLVLSRRRCFCSIQFSGTLVFVFLASRLLHARFCTIVLFCFFPNSYLAGFFLCFAPNFSCSVFWVWPLYDSLFRVVILLLSFGSKQRLHQDGCLLLLFLPVFAFAFF